MAEVMVKVTLPFGDELELEEDEIASVAIEELCLDREDFDHVLCGLIREAQEAYMCGDLSKYEELGIIIEEEQ